MPQTSQLVISWRISILILILAILVWIGFQLSRRFGFGRVLGTVAVVVATVLLLAAIGGPPIAVAALALLIGVGFVLAQRFGFARVLGVTAAIVVPAFLLLTVPIVSHEPLATSLSLTRLTAEVSVDEAKDPPPAWSAETNEFLADVYPTLQDAADMLAKHSIEPLAQALSKNPNDLNLTSSHAIVILEPELPNVGHSVMAKLRYDLQDRFPDAVIKSFESNGPNAVDPDTLADLAQTEKESVLLSVSMSSVSYTHLTLPTICSV